MVPGGIRLRSQAHDVSWNHHNWVNRMQEYLQARCPIATPQHLWWDQNEVRNLLPRAGSALCRCMLLL